MKAGEIPDYRNVSRGIAWMRLIVEASEAMDQGNKDAMDRALESIETNRERARQERRRERDPGEEG